MAATPSSKQVRARWMHHRRDVLLLLYLMTAALSWHSRWAAALESRGANQLQQSHRQFTSASASGAAFAFPTIECLISRDRRNRYFCAPSALFPGKRGGGPVKEVGQAAPRPRNARLGINVIRGRSSIASYCQRRGGEGGGGGGGGGEEGGGGGGGGAAAAAEEGNIALVTGANRGLGRGLVQELASSGYTVIACCRDKKNGDELAAQVQAPGSSVISYELDVSSEHSIRALSAAIESRSLPAPNLLINNAGICIQGSSNDILQQTLDVNFYGALRMIRALSPAMRQRSSSHVINISSGEGEIVYLCSRLQKDIPLATSVEQLTSLLQGCLELDEELAFGDTPAYSVSKAALNALTRILAAEEGEKGLGIRSVCPGDVDTAMCMLDNKDGVLSPEEAARDVVWVATHPSECRTGHFFRAREQIPW